MTEIYDEYDIVSNQFIEDGIEPTLETIRKLDYLKQQLTNRCDTFDELEADHIYESFHQYFSRGCRFYVRAYDITLDGLKNKSIDRIEYGYLDFNIGYDYFEQIFTEDEVEASTA